MLFSGHSGADYRPSLRARGEEVYVAYLDEDANEVQYALSLARQRRPKGFLFLGGDMEFFRKDFKHLTCPAYF